MDWEEMAHFQHPTTLTRIRLYCEAQRPERNSADESLYTKMEEVANKVKYYNKYSNEQKLLFVYYNGVKLFNTTKSGSLAGGIIERTVQK
jgi:hypothetical protein